MVLGSKDICYQRPNCTLLSESLSKKAIETGILFCYTGDLDLGLLRARISSEILGSCKIRIRPPSLWELDHILGSISGDSITPGSVAAEGKELFQRRPHIWAASSGGCEAMTTSTSDTEDPKLILPALEQIYSYVKSVEDVDNSVDRVLGFVDVSCQFRQQLMWRDSVLNGTLKIGVVECEERNVVSGRSPYRTLAGYFEPHEAVKIQNILLRVRCDLADRKCFEVVLPSNVIINSYLESTSAAF